MAQHLLKGRMLAQHLLEGRMLVHQHMLKGSMLLGQHLQRAKCWMKAGVCSNDCTKAKCRKEPS